MLFALALSLSALNLVGCGSLAKTVVSDPAPAAQAYQRTRDLRALVDALALPVVERGETPGLIVGVRLADGRQHVFGYGRANDFDAEAPSADTAFAIGSVTKLLVGAVAQRLAQRGVIDWDDTLRESLPANVALSEDAARITLRQLAAHTSGLPRQPAELRTLWLFTQYLFNGRDFYRHLDRDHVYRYLADWKAPDPDQVLPRRYSNIGFALLSHVLELRTRRSIDELVDEELVRPLGLRRTTFDASRVAIQPARASGHAGDQPKFIARGTAVEDWRMNDFMRGTGGLYSTVADLLRYADAHLREGGDDVHAALAATLRAEPTRIGWLPAAEEGGPQVYQFGVIAGYSAYLGLDTQRDIAVVVLQNSFNWTDHIGFNLMLRLARANDLARAPSAIGRDMGS